MTLRLSASGTGEGARRMANAPRLGLFLVPVDKIPPRHELSFRCSTITKRTADKDYWWP